MLVRGLSRGGGTWLNVLHNVLQTTKAKIKYKSVSGCGLKKNRVDR